MPCLTWMLLQKPSKDFSPMPKYRKPQGRSVRPTFFVFCEGETEEEYVSFLRSHFRVPIEIDASVTGLGLTKEHIERYKRGKTTMAKDRNFLIFDLDRPEILQRLEAIPDATIIATNPCFELWYLLHYTARRTALTSEDCIKKLLKANPKYKKGHIDKTLREILAEKMDTATERAAALTTHGNPSTDVPQFIAALKEQ